MIIAITGSSGLVGTALIHALEADGHLIRPVVRRAPRQGANEIRWDPDNGTIDAAEFASVDAVVHPPAKTSRPSAGRNRSKTSYSPAASAARSYYATRSPV
jgi:nucleoside-diphosphate-sugar epimerase